MKAKLCVCRCKALRWQLQSFARAYARVQLNEVISTKQFINHISEMFICYFVCLFVPSFRNNYHIRNLILI